MSVRQLLRTAGLTQASSVMPLVRSRLAESGTVTQVVEPLNWIAEPNLPDADHVPFASVPLLLFPDESPAAVPLPSSNAYAATRPGSWAETVAVACADAALMFPAASSAVTR